MDELSSVYAVQASSQGPQTSGSPDRLFGMLLPLPITFWKYEHGHFAHGVAQRDSIWPRCNKR